MEKKMCSETILSLKSQSDLCSLSCSEVYSASLRDLDPEAIFSQGSLL